MNRYYKIPISELKDIDPDWETRRKNVDATEAIMHIETYDTLVSKKNKEIMPLSEDSVEWENYPVYQGWRNCWPARNGHRIRKEVFDEMVERK